MSILININKNMKHKKLLAFLIPALLLMGSRNASAYIHEDPFNSTKDQCASYVGVQSSCSDGKHKYVKITGYKYENGLCTLYSECDNGLGTIVTGGAGGTGAGTNPNTNSNASAKANPPVVTIAAAVPSVTLPWINTAADCSLQNNKSFGVCPAGKTGSPVLVKCAYGAACVCQVDSSKCGVIKMNPNASLLSVAPAPTAGLPTASMGVPVSNLNFTSGGKAVTATGFYKTAAGQYYFLSKSNLVYNPQSLTDIISHPEIYANDIAK